MSFTVRAPCCSMNMTMYALQWILAGRHCGKKTSFQTRICSISAFHQLSLTLLTFANRYTLFPIECCSFFSVCGRLLQQVEHFRFRGS